MLKITLHQVQVKKHNKTKWLTNRTLQQAKKKSQCTNDNNNINKTKWPMFRAENCILFLKENKK